MISETAMLLIILNLGIFGATNASVLVRVVERDAETWIEDGAKLSITSERFSLSFNALHEDTGYAECIDCENTIAKLAENFENPSEAQSSRDRDFPESLKGTYGIPVKDMIPFGTDNSDLALPTMDDAFVPVTLLDGFKFANLSYNKLFINTNGGITFIKGSGASIPDCSPLSIPTITPFWADIDTQIGGNITYRQATENATLSKVEPFLQKAFPGMSFDLKWAFVMTTYDVPFFGASPPAFACPGSALRNTFQTILTLGGTESYVIFLYNKIDWVNAYMINGDGGNHCSGFNGKHNPFAGLDAADGKARYQVAYACTRWAEYIPTTTNINIPGVWVFRVTSGISTPCDVVCLSNVDMLPDPYDCSNYYVCSNGEKIKHECPRFGKTGQLVYNPKSKVCVAPKDYPCEPICQEI
ncbi:sushi, nidogen and EGF-like domain-containing protein 1 [Folsomia candida]|uniref:sushi, nidogen and EGF-like domain-containing protein 1 n=1 Tax=Folsomia candida TaxID=158441 RepID=UPI001604B859|nr:sushi, nidogen and EGF-like domain-containing protein 1 [Folsomia candida]